MYKCSREGGVDEVIVYFDYEELIEECVEWSDEEEDVSCSMKDVLCLDIFFFSFKGSIFWSVENEDF